MEYQDEHFSCMIQLSYVKFNYLLNELEEITVDIHKDHLDEYINHMTRPKRKIYVLAIDGVPVNGGVNETI